MSADVEIRYIPSPILARQTADLLRGWGMIEEDVAVTTAALLDADLRGVDTHGISLLPLFAGWMKTERFDLAARPKIVKDGPAFALIDAGAALGFAVSVFATRLAVEKARSAGVASVSVFNSHHFGAAGYYARLAARENLMSLVATSTRLICVVPPNAAEPVLGTNPLAFGIPSPDGEPIVLDMATSTAAGNRVRLFHLKNKPLPVGWVVDGNGDAVVDPHEGYEFVYNRNEGGLTPLGGNLELGSHKGYGLALMVHFLAATLSGGAFPPAKSSENGRRSPDNVGHFFLAIDPAAFRNYEDFLGDVGEVARTLRQTRATDPSRPVLLPGDIENRTRAERLRTGIPLPVTLLAQLRALAASLKVPFHFDDQSAPGAGLSASHDEKIAK